MFPCVWENVNLTDFTLHCFCKLGKTLHRVLWDLHHSFEVFKGTYVFTILQFAVIELYAVVVEHCFTTALCPRGNFVPGRNVPYSGLWLLWTNWGHLECFLCNSYRHYFSDVTSRTQTSVYTWWGYFKPRASFSCRDASHHVENVRSEWGAGRWGTLTFHALVLSFVIIILVSSRGHLTRGRICRHFCYR